MTQGRTSRSRVNRDGGLRTEPALWAAVLRELEQTFVYQCPPECECRREVAPYA